jgi:hypothetical protein
MQSYKKIISAPKNCQSFDGEIITNQAYMNEIEKVTLSSSFCLVAKYMEWQYPQRQSPIH